VRRTWPLAAKQRLVRSEVTSGWVTHSSIQRAKHIEEGGHVCAGLFGNDVEVQRRHWRAVEDGGGSAYNDELHLTLAQDPDEFPEVSGRWMGHVANL
jgi:hypothetical protein